MPREEAEALALQALLWLLSNENRAERLLQLTGLTPDDLRAGLGDPSVLAALLGFLTSYEPDLIDFANEQRVPPDHIPAAYHALSGEHWDI